MSDDMKQACLPPEKQDEWISFAAEFVANEKEAVGSVMRQSGGRCNPQYVVDEYRRLRATMPAHLISYQDREESEVYCESTGYPRTENVSDVTCRQCLDRARTEAFDLANACDKRRRELGGG